MFSYGESDKKLAWTRKANLATLVTNCQDSFMHNNSDPPPQHFLALAATCVLYNRTELYLLNQVLRLIRHCVFTNNKKKARCRLRAVSLFLGPSSKKARDTQITTRVTEGTLVSRASRRINALARMHSPH